MTIKLKRIYEPYSEEDGYRLLIDRLWPRGMKKEDVHIDKWVKDVAPSNTLRKWFNHQPEKWDEFRRRYHAELNGSAILDELNSYVQNHETITFLFAAKEQTYNHAIALQQFINKHPSI